MTEIKKASDLHILYHMETGQHHSWIMNGFHADTRYKNEYSTWLEEKFIELLSQKTDLNKIENENDELQSRIFDLEVELDDLEITNNNLQVEVCDLKNELEQWTGKENKNKQINI